jgi:hypothetical protein
MSISEYDIACVFSQKSTRLQLGAREVWNGIICVIISDRRQAICLNTLFIQVYCPYATLGYERPTPHLLTDINPFGHTSGASEIILTDPIYRLVAGGETAVKIKNILAILSESVIALFE